MLLLVMVYAILYCVNAPTPTCATRPRRGRRRRRHLSTLITHADTSPNISHPLVKRNQHETCENACYKGHTHRTIALMIALVFHVTQPNRALAAPRRAGVLGGYCQYPMNRHTIRPTVLHDGENGSFVSAAEPGSGGGKAKSGGRSGGSRSFARASFAIAASSASRNSPI